MNSEPPSIPGNQGHGSYSDKPPAGWYRDEYGSMRWWDGNAWTMHTGPNPAASPNPYAIANYQQSVESERNLALLAHLLGLFTGFLGPLILYLVAKDDQPFAKHHAAEALNFQLTVMILSLVSVLLVLVLVGIVMIFVVAIGALILEIMACVAAHRGEWYRYPINFRMVSGAR